MLFRSSDFLADFERLTRGLDLGAEFEGLVDGLSKNFGTNLPTSPHDTPRGTPGFRYGPGVDAVNTADAFELHIDVPGVDPSSVEVTVDGHDVTVRATREFAPDEGAEVVYRGRRHGETTRTFRLGDDLNPDELSARSEHGVLVLSVPRSAAAEPRRIEVITTD